MKAEETQRWLDLPEWAKDAIYTEIDVHLSVRDALRLLWHRKLTLSVKTSTEVRPGRLESTSRVRIPPFRWPWQKHMSLGVTDAPRSAS